MAGCGADNLANEIAESLSGGLNFDIAIPDFSGPEYEFPSDTGGERLPVTPITTADLTTQHVGGSGVFDALMSAFKSHLDQEYEKSRITGKDYAEAYVALTNGAMGNATQFLLGKDQAYWSAVGAQIAARTAEVQLVTSRVQLAAEKTKLQMLKFDAMNAQANFLLTKMRLASESMAYCISKYNLEEMMPLQKAALINENNLSVQRLATLKVETANTGKQGQLLDAEILLAPKKADQLDKQIANVGAQTNLTNKQVELADAEVKLAPKKATMLDKQIAGAEAQTSLTTKQVALAQSELDLAPKKSVMLDKQIANQEAQTTQTAAQTEQVKAQTSYVGKQGTFIDKQIEQITEELKLQPYKKTLMQEQAEAARAQTADTRSDGTPIAGSLGKQKDLYNQQILSYQRDAEMKAAKVFIDAWITMKTIDEGLAPPNGFANSNLDQILTSLRTKNGI